MWSMIDRVICTDEQKKAVTTSSIGRRVLRKIAFDVWSSLAISCQFKAVLVSPKPRALSLEWQSPLGKKGQNCDPLLVILKRSLFSIIRRSSSEVGAPRVRKLAPLFYLWISFEASSNCRRSLYT
ncbi:unnamed protein product [Xylocopa violacea]|uniref:Uncharacterized protein n=1 Tax=Xylocopa violacea TaxID=135666 RepID=A0ABP1P4Q1_XYLVO